MPKRRYVYQEGVWHVKRRWELYDVSLDMFHHMPFMSHGNRSGECYRTKREKTIFINERRGPRGLNTILKRLGSRGRLSEVASSLVVPESSRSDAVSIF